MTKKPTEAPLPYERQPGETARAYSHFIAYRQMPTTVRSLRRLAEELGRGDYQLFDWSRRWNWVERVKAWDDYCDMAQREAMLDGIREAGVTRVKVAVVGLQLLHDRLVGADAVVDRETGEVIRDKVKAIDANRLDAKDLSALGNMLSKMQGLAEEAAGVKAAADERPVEVRLSFDLDGVQGAGHRVVEAVAKRVGPGPPALDAAPDDTGDNTEG